MLIAIAVLIQLGRQAFPLVKDYQQEISDYLGDKMGMLIELESVDASWSGMRPKVSLSQVHIKSLSGDSVFKIDKATLELSILNSLRDRRFSWRQLILDGFETTLSQSAKGRWAIEGMPEFVKKDKQDRDKIRFDDPYDIFLVGRRIKISDAKFSLRYLSGVNTTIQVPVISIDNDRDFHRIKASLDVGLGEKAFDMVIEGHGDPRDSDFVANGFLELKNFPTSDVLDALALAPVREEGDQKLNLKLWLRGDAEKGTTFSGDLSANGTLKFEDNKFELPDALASKFYGEIKSDNSWTITLKRFAAEWEGKSSPLLDVELYGDFRKFGGVRIPAIEAEPWTQLAIDIGLNSEFAEKIIKQLNPRGLIKNIDVAFTDKQSGYFLLRANVENGFSNAVMGAPAFDNINGYLSANLRSGSFDVRVDDGLGMDLPKVYHDPLFFAQAEGQIRWLVDFKNKITYISSGLLSVTNPEEEGRGYFNLSLPFSKKYGEQQLTLAIGIKNTLAKNHKKYVPKTIPKDLYAWLGTSIKKGQVSNARFLYNGSVEKDPVVSPSIQLYGEVTDGDLVFDPKWPKLDGVSGSLTLNNNDLNVHIDKASLLGNSIYDAEIKLVKEQLARGLALSIKGSLASDAESAMALMKNSPIKESIGSTFDTWQVSGGVGAKVELIVPLNAESSGLSHKIEVAFREANLVIPELSIEIDKISGKLFYHTDKGLFADELKGSIWNREFISSISSPKNDKGGLDTLIAFEGRAGIDSLYDWTQRPELRFANGSAHVEGSIHIPSEKTQQAIEVKVSSDLDGVAINLPEPFGKAEEDKTDFDSRIQFYNYAEQYQFTLGEQLRLTLLSAKNATTSAQLEINSFAENDDSMLRIANTGRFDISGNIDVFDLIEWNEIKDQYFVYVDDILQGEPDDSPAMPAEFEVDIKKFLLGTFEIENLTVDGGREIDFWDLNIESKLMSGKVRVPEDDGAITLDLDYLRFELEDEESLVADAQLVDEADNRIETPNALYNETPSQSVLADIDLTQAVPLDFSTKELSLGQSNYGNWDFELRPIENGITIRNIAAQSKGMTLGSGDEGGEFIWTKQDDKQLSRFKGKITAKNLAQVFQEFGQEELLQSEKASIDIDARWPGAPDQATLKTLKGVVGVNILRGSFARGAGSDENGLLRLIALFNFDTILRRLRLDFSDLAAQGYSYDKIYGDLDFSDGKIILTDPLIVESSSSYLQLVGTVDLIDETLDSEMVVTLPVASNVALATAVIVGLPAALGVYVMSKLFKKQVDRASSLNVGVTGEWEDPKVKVKKIFDLDAANRRGREMKEQGVTASP